MYPSQNIPERDLTIDLIDRKTLDLYLDDDNSAVISLAWPDSQLIESVDERSHAQPLNPLLVHACLVGISHQLVWRVLIGWRLLQ